MTPLPTQPFRAALERSLDELIRTLKEAEDYLGGGNDLAAVGTLCTFADQADDLKAALRLYTRVRRAP